jgi:two-component system, NarL family, nitrate/nitrite response regulator NarL
MTSDPSPRIQLLVVDDHTLFRRGLKALLSQDERFEPAREAADVGEALRSLAQARPDVILLDNHLPGVRGVEAIPALKEAAPGCRILMLTVSENEEDLAAALQAGADGYLLKTVESDQLCDAIVKVLEGRSVVSPEMMTKLFSVFRSQGAAAPAGAPAPAVAPAPAGPEEAARAAADGARDEGIAKLSARERQILALIARGDSNKLIARELDIAETTVKIHVQHILRKLNLSNRVHAAVYASERGVI